LGNVASKDLIGDNIMALVINTNLGSINGQRNLNASAGALSTAMTRLSSGLRVNNAKDDAAGLAIADRMNSQVRGMTVAVRNANDGISLTQTAEGALGALTDTLQRMRDLAVQSSSNAGVSATDRAKMDTEFKSLNDELLRVIDNSEFNGKKILGGDLAGGLNIQVGATTDTNSRISVAVSNMAQLLKPVTTTSLAPATRAVDSTLAAAISKASTDAVDAAINPALSAANAAAAAANAAVVAAKKAADAPTDLALAKAASTANARAAALLAISSATANADTITNRGRGLVPQAFTDTVANQDAANQSTNTAVQSADATMQARGTTDATQAASLLTTANQLAKSATDNVSASAQNLYVATMNSLTGDTIDVLSTARDNSNLLTASNTLNDAVNRAIKAGNAFGSDRAAQKTLAGFAIAKAIASASFVADPLKTATSNETDKTSFVNNSALVKDVSTAADAVAADYALSAINYIDAAIAAIDTERSNLGSTQNRFTTTIANLQNGIENQSAAKSRILDADFAQETANLSRAQILQQAGTAMLAQANQSGQTVMTLLR
jgi:flagellin